MEVLPFFPLSIIHKGLSKIDHETSTVLTTLPINTYLSPLTLSIEDCELVESFVAMTLSKDGESVEVNYLVHRNNITLENLQDLLHHVLCVVETDLFTFLSDRASPVQISPPGNWNLTFKSPTMIFFNLWILFGSTDQLPLLRNRFTKEIISSGRQQPSLSIPLCNGPFKTQEINFISDKMLDDIPFNQVLIKSLNTDISKIN